LETVCGETTVADLVVNCVFVNSFVCFRNYTL